MERLMQRLQLAEKALGAFDEILKKEFDSIIRDAAIQRFEFTFEASWKLLQLYLLEKEGIENNSPKSVFRSSLQVKLLSEEETSMTLQMVDDRNLTVHTYNEELAVIIYNRLPTYNDLFTLLVKNIKSKL